MLSLTALLLPMVVGATELLSLADWVIVDDGVMGGLSQGKVTVSDAGVVRFSGELSLENNGGFSSTRAMLRSNLDDAERLILRVRGDGRRYQLRLRAGRQFDGVAWRHHFDTSEQWQTIALPLDDFEPVWRGRQVRKERSFPIVQAQQLGFLLGDKTPGAFWLEIARIEISTEHTDKPH